MFQRFSALERFALVVLLSWIGVLCAGHTPAAAQSIEIVYQPGSVSPQTYTINMADADGGYYNGDYYVHTNPDSSWYYAWSGTYSIPGLCTVKWGNDVTAPPGDPSWPLGPLQLDPDPSVAGNVSLVNNTGVTSLFSVSVFLPVAPIPSGAPMSGSSTISIGDSDTNAAATLAAPPASAIYNALIDVTTIQRKLFNNPYSLSPPPIPGATTGDSQFFTGEFTTNPITSSIGINHFFSLTPGDTATMNSTFLVVPEPGTLTITVAGLIAVGVLRMRRGRQS